MRTREYRAGSVRAVVALCLGLGVLVAILLYATRDRGSRIDSATPSEWNGAESRAVASRSASPSKSTQAGGSVRSTKEASPVAPAVRPGLQTPSDLAATDETTPESPAAALARKQELQFARARRAAVKTGVPAPTAGEPPDARAEVVLNGKTHDLEPGPSGAFPDLPCQALSTADVTVVYSSAEGPSDVILQAEDGGVFPDGSSVRAVRLDKANTARFTFINGVQHGLFRVTLRRGADIKTIPFWVELAARADGERKAAKNAKGR